MTDIQKIRKILKNYIPHAQPLTYSQLSIEEHLTTAMPAAVLVGLEFRDGEWHLLLTKRSAQLEDHAGQISFVGGRVEDSDIDHQQAALREAHEEIGLPSNNVEIIGKLQTQLVGLKYLVTPFVGIVSAFTPTIDPIEVEELFYAPLSFFLTDSHCLPDQRKAGYDGFQFQYAEKNIWGGTSSIIMNFKDILNNAA